VIKNWTVGRPGNEATLSNGYMISMSGYSVDAQLELFAGFKSEVCSMSRLQLPE